MEMMTDGDQRQGSEGRTHRHSAVAEAEHGDWAPVIRQHGHARGGCGAIHSRRRSEVGSDEAREHPRAIAAAQRRPGGPRHTHGSQRLPPPDHAHLDPHPFLLPVVVHRGQVNGDGIVGRGQRDHELGLEAERDLILVVPRRPVELDAEAEVAVACASGGGRGEGYRGRRCRGGRGRGRRMGRGRGLIVVVVIVVPVVEREVEDLGAALPAQAPRHGGRALRIKLWMRRAGLRLGCRKMERCEDGDVESSRVETREGGGCPGGGRERREEGGLVAFACLRLCLVRLVSSLWNFWVYLVFSLGVYEHPKSTTTGGYRRVLRPASPVSF